MNPLNLLQDRGEVEPITPEDEIPGSWVYAAKDVLRIKDLECLKGCDIYIDVLVVIARPSSLARAPLWAVVLLAVTLIILGSSWFCDSGPRSRPSDSARRHSMNVQALI